MNGFKEIRILGIKNYFLKQLIEGARQCADNTVKKETLYLKFHHYL